MKARGYTIKHVIIYQQPYTFVNYQQPLFNNGQQVRKLANKLFDYFDFNKTGKLDSRKFVALLEFAVKTGIIQSKTNNLFVEFTPKINKNSQGLIDKYNLAQFMRNYIKPSFNPTKMLSLQFPSYMSKIQQKIINKQQTRYKNLGYYSEIQLKNFVQQAFYKYDRNRSGELDYQELTNYLKIDWGNQISYSQFIQQYDYDKNGLVSPDQLFNFLKKMNKISIRSK